MCAPPGGGAARMFPYASIPRPEYPRPGRQRASVQGVDWLNLNGPWQFRFDPEQCGVDEVWFARDQPNWREQIIASFCWESPAAWGESDAAGTENYYSTRVFLAPLDDVTLPWLFSGFDSLGHMHPELARGCAPIAFPQSHVELACHIAPMLCTLSVAAVTSEGKTAASNFVQYRVTNGVLPLREERDAGPTVVLRPTISEWTAGEWSGGVSRASLAEGLGACFGRGTGFFEWEVADEALQPLGGARRVRIRCEVSARRDGERQTGAHRDPTLFELSVNGLRAHQQVLPDHPHDSRGALSYLRGGRGAYGYLMRATVEHDLLRRLAETTSFAGVVRRRCTGPRDASPAGGLTVYGPDAGRYPLGPTLIIEWEDTELSRET